MLPKYKLLATLYLSQRFNGSTGSPPSADLFRHLLGTSYNQTISRLLHENLIEFSTSSNNNKIYSSSERRESRSNYEITYLGTNALLSHYPLLDYFQFPFRHSEVYGPKNPRLLAPERSDGGQVNSRDPSPSIPQGQDDGDGYEGGGDGGWDGGKFTLVVFNIPEEKRQIRDRLRYVLKSAGFGQINRSLYITPHLTVKEATHLLSSSGGNGFAFSVPFESFKEIDKGALTNFWDLEEVEELYDEAMALWESGPLSCHSEVSDPKNPRLLAPERSDGGQVNSRDPSPSIPQGQDDGNGKGMSGLRGGRFLSKFLDAFGKDPFLPPLLLGNNWPGRKALEIAKEILTV